jgi:hypothetical protein
MAALAAATFVSAAGATARANTAASAAAWNTVPSIVCDRNIHRQSSDHLSFGQGVHFCVGAGLGRMEARVAFERLFSRLDEIKLAVSPEEIRYVGAFTRRLERLPLSVSGR